MSRLRRQQNGEHKQTPSPGQDLPPSYEDTLKTGGGGFVEPGVPVKTIVQVVQVPMPELGPQPARIQCPSCQMDITTATTTKPSAMAWTLSLVICFTMLWPCFCLPFCVDSLQNVKHKCPNCKVTLGRYHGSC